MSMRQRFLVLALWGLALALVAWTLGQLPLGEMFVRLAQLDWQDYLWWSLTNVLILALAVKRWQALAFALHANLGMSWLFRLRQAGGAVSFITPGPQFGGEPLQLFWLNRHARLPLHQAIAVLGLDRLLETGTNIAVLLAGVLLMVGTAIMPVAQWLQVAAVLLLILGALVTTTLVIIHHPGWLAERFRRIASHWQSDKPPEGNTAGWEQLAALLRQAVVQERPRLWLASGLAIAGWGLLLFELLLLLRFLGLSVTVADLILIMLGMRLAMLLPAPGGIGTVEASLFWSFSFLGLPLSAAAGVIALTRLRDVVILLIGLGCLAGLQRPFARRNKTPAANGI